MSRAPVEAVVHDQRRGLPLHDRRDRAHAAREIASGVAFPPRDAYFEEFEASFPFEETPDQGAAIEEVLASHTDVAEAAVIGAADSLKGQMPLGLVVLNAGVDREREDIVRELVGLVREQIGPVAAFKTAVVVDRLPKTRSGKILRGTMKKIADSDDYKMPATIDDPAILDEITEVLREVGYGA